jgi:hypothetical protein
MKLYKEEQLLNTVNAIQSYIQKFGIDGAQPTIKNHLKMLEPIELPSDEEIKDKSFNKFAQSNARTCFEEGAKWVREQIINQNK